ncbi:hypothetical protein [Kosakonia phage Kc304]|nr:hypothetical protein [Kosakonia phage Kc304]
MAQKFKNHGRYCLSDTLGFSKSHIYNEVFAKMIMEHGNDFRVVNFKENDYDVHTIIMATGAKAGTGEGTIDSSFMLCGDEAEFFTEITEDEGHETVFFVTSKEQAERAIKAISAAWFN